MNIIVGITSCWKMQNRRQRVARTWLKDLKSQTDVLSTFFVGCYELDHTERHADMLLLPSPDGYEFLPAKVREFFKWALTQEDWKFCIKADDDCRVDARRLLRYIDRLTTQDYIGVPVEERSHCCNYQPHGHIFPTGVVDPERQRLYASGPLYILSRRAVEILAHSTHPDMGAEDMLCGRTLREHGIYLTPEQDRFRVLAGPGVEPDESNRLIFTSPASRLDE